MRSGIRGVVSVSWAVLFAAAVMLVAADAQARDTIRIVGSSTVFPFAAAVAERFGQSTKYPPPIIESTGTGGAMQLFCQGIGVAHPDSGQQGLIAKLREQYTIVIVTHNTQQALRVAQRVAFFYEGEIVEVGSTYDIFNHPRDERTRDYVKGLYG